MTEKLIRGMLGGLLRFRSSPVSITDKLIAIEAVDIFLNITENPQVI